MKYYITTNYYQRYVTDKDGYVLEFSNGLKKDENSESRKTWQIMGIREIEKFNNLGTLISLKDAIKISNFRFKNGNPKYTIQDLDHGTTRIHGNTKVHGIISITKSE